MRKEEFLDRIDGIMCGTSNAERAYLADLYDEVNKPHWISVEDELPKVGQSCIILIDRKALQGTPRIRRAVYAPKVMMQQEGFAYNRMSKKHHITHWMPLPQAPEGGEQ